MKNPINLIIALCVALVLAGTGYNVYRMMSKDSGYSGGESSIVLIDMLRIETAQQLQVKKILGNAVNTSDYASAFRAAGDVIAAAEAVAPGKTIAVKQAFLSSKFPDITGAVIEHMGLPAPEDSRLDADILLDSESPNVSVNSSRDKQSGSTKEDSLLPY